ncbi:sensor histidine kinase [Luteibacter aegosomatissinici]|uniref:sensor histidine kinase n=1 Tax=Luteibacter aegosomatissinici TaxID=2911539 RepID=UPI001FF9C7C5|nr:triple tyrosine motif-containing protein [Luteibacter aegosomatissinici]UPG92868.1 histidine kinase [Luteibacter aegosomatissinici]
MLLSLWCLSAGTPAAPSLPLSQYDHFAQRFLHEAPNEIILMTESSDGLLWLVSGSKLLTFDGLRMAPYRSPAGQPELPLDIPTALMTARDGTVWVGYTTGDIASVGTGGTRVFGHDTGLPNTDIESIFEDSSGSVYAETEAGGIFVLQGSTWVVRYGIRRDTRFSMDSADTLWGASPGKISWLARGERSPHEIPTRGWSADVLHEAPDHSMWALARREAPSAAHAVGRGCTLRRLNLPGHRAEELAVPVPCGPVGRGNLWLDADGSVWVASFSGALHVRPSADPSSDGSHAWTVEGFTAANGLTSDSAYLVRRDSFGNVWFAGKDGLDRFTPPTLHKFDSIPEHQLKLAAGPAGHVWIAGWHTPLRLVGTGEDTVHATERQWSTLYGAPDGALWAATSNPSGFGVARPGGKHFEEISLPKKGSFTAQAITGDADGILVSYEGLWRYANGTWSSIDQGDLNDVDEPVAMLTDRRGRVWLGYADGPLASLQGNTIRRWDGDVGMVEVFLDSSRGVFAGGAKGIAFFDGQRFRTLRTDDPLTVHNVSGLVEAPNGDVWVNGEEGVALLSAGEVGQALADPAHVIEVQSFSGGDLSGGRSPYVRPSAVLDGAGRAWFSISRYIAYIDLGQKTPLRPPSKVSIRSIEADSVPLHAGEAIPAGTHTLSIGYVGVNLAAPEQVRYRYRLDGEDKAWRDAGRGTEAIYTGLKNGKYRFEVMASNGAGTWTTLATPLELDVLPLVYQTLWFRLLCLLAVVTCLLVLVQLRVRAAETEVRARLSGRYGERLRISRELHDTLLQGVQGLAMKFSALARQVVDQPDLSERMELALRQADQLMVEGRNRVQDLRSDAPDDADLMTRLQHIAHMSLVDTAVAVAFVETGKARPLSPSVHLEFDAIAREALTNVARHARASEVCISVLFRPRAVHLIIADDGGGIPADVLAAGGRPGHWGLRGMHERAAGIGGRLKVLSADPSGTRLELILPASIAFAERRKRRAG